MMCYDKARQTNYEILEMTQKRMAELLEKGKWDAEVFNAMSSAIKNIERLDELMEVKEEDVAEYKTNPATSLKSGYTSEQTTPKAKTDDSEFKKVIYDIIATKGNRESMEHITNVLDDYLKDVKVLQPRAYNSLMAKLKG